MYWEINDVAFVSLTRKLRSWTRNIELDKLLPSNSNERGYLYLVVYDEDVVSMSTTAYMIILSHSSSRNYTMSTTMIVCVTYAFLECVAGERGESAICTFH